MNRPTTAREALIVEVLGDMARVVDRVEALVPALDRNRAALSEAGAALRDQVALLEAQANALTHAAKQRVVSHIAQHAQAAATRASELQVHAMRQAARGIFVDEVEPSMQRLASSMSRLADRFEGQRESWLVHSAVAAASCVLTWTITFYALRG